MLESRASQTPGINFGFVLIAGLALLDFGLLFLLVNEPVTLLSFLWGMLLLVSMPAVAFIAYWTSSLGSTRYHVAGDTLVIEWGPIHQLVPLAQIRSVVRGSALQQVKRFRGVRWPGCFVGYGQVRVRRDDGTFVDQETIFYATRPLQAQLLLLTDSVAYCLSPVDLENFADCLVALRVPELVSQSAQPRSGLSLADWRIWQDKWALPALYVAALLNGTLFALLCLIFSDLPITVSLHYSASGVADRFGSPAGLFVLPLLGLLSWLSNGAVGWMFYQLRNERTVAFILWGASILVQLVTWIAVLGLLT